MSSARSGRLARAVAWTIAAYGVVSVALAAGLAELAPAAPAALHLPRTLVFDAGVLAFALPAALVIGRHPSNPVGWILASVAVVSGITNVAAGYAGFALYGPGLPGGMVAAWIFSWTYAWALGPAGTLLFLFFPNGRLPSRAWRPVAWLSVLGILGFGGSDALLPGPVPIFGRIEEPVGVPSFSDELLSVLVGSATLLLVTMVASAGSLWYRARAASAAERQQLKWVGYAAGIVSATTVAVAALGLPALVGAEVITYALLSIPVAVGLAMLRYRLYDIDVLINRTVVYGVLSAILVAVYAVVVAAAQAFLRPLTGGSEMSIAGSTLAVVALFQPLRRRIQDAVDRRFYRSRYDAARTLDAFTARLRSEVDIDSVRADLLDVVGTTIRPAHASVWLRAGRR